MKLETLQPGMPKWLTRLSLIGVILFLIWLGYAVCIEQMPVKNTMWALAPPVIAIMLALITKEVYSSLFFGILTGALLNADFDPVGGLNRLFPDGIMAMLSDKWNVGILVFLVILGTMVQLMNRTGGSAAFGTWAALLENSAAGLMSFLPAIIFVVAVGLAFASGTSWGTFGILIPIVVSSFQTVDPQLMIISISACMAGAVCGDHCSPISDTSIMSSAGAQCNHLNHVTTQLPYALTAAAVSFFTFLVAGFTKNALISLVFGVVVLFLVLVVIKKMKR